MKYQAQLEVHANVPENQQLELDLNYSITYPIYCPKNRCKNLKKNGFDHNHSQNPQWFKCKKHGNSFYAHTSWVISMLTEIIVNRILKSLFTGKAPASTLADDYNISASVITSLIHNNQKYVEYIINKFKEIKSTVKPLLNEDSNTKIIWLDEIFFKVGKISHALILAIDSNYDIVGWKLGRTRNADDVLEVLHQVDKRQEWNILIGDGSTAYPKALLLRGKDCYFFCHKHSHPWKDSQIHKFEVLPDKSIVQSIVELRYDVMIKAEETPQQAYALEKTYIPKKENTKRGRPKGSKNKIKKKNTSKKGEEKGKKKRGPKTPKKNGRPFVIDRSTEIMHVEWEDPTISVNHSSNNNSSIPSIHVVQELMWMAFAVFQGGYIISNLIESMNSLIRLSMPSRGVRNETQLKDHVNGFIQTRMQKDEELNKSSMSLPIRSSLGYFNLDKFLSPTIENISILTQYGGV